MILKGPIHGSGAERGGGRMRGRLWGAVMAMALCLSVGKGEQRVAMPEVVPTPPIPPVEEPFADVSFGQRWYDGAQYGYRRGVIRGITEDSFGGELTATRAMTAVMLWRMAGEPEAPGESRFQDIKGGKYYTAAVIWGERRGLWEGYGDGTFRPDAGMTWSQLELVLERYCGEVTIFPEKGVRGEGKTTLSRGELAQVLMELEEDNKYI